MSNPVPNALALNTIVNGTTADATPVESNFSETQVAVNGLISCLSGGSVGQLLSAVDATDVQWVNKSGIYRKVTTKTVFNTITETDLLNGEITVGANAIGASGVLRLTAWGDMFNTSGSTQAFSRFKLKLGATTLLDTNVLAATWATSAFPFGWRIGAEIMNLGATNSQWATIDAKLSASVAASVAAAFTTGEGIFSSSSSGDMAFAVGGNATVVDTTASQTLALTVTQQVASSNVTTSLKGALVEIV